jgi:hypothetical protein
MLALRSSLPDLRAASLVLRRVPPERLAAATGDGRPTVAVNAGGDGV